MAKQHAPFIFHFAAVILTAGATHGADHAAALAPFLTDDVVAVTYADITSIDALGILDWADDLGLMTADERTELSGAALELQQRLDELADFGVNNVYCLVRVADIRHGGPTWVIPVANAASAKTAINLIVSGRPDGADAGDVDRPAWLPTIWQNKSGALVGGYSAEQIESQLAAEPAAPRDTRKAWQALGDGSCGLIVLGDRDSRRVIRDMFPKLPAPFEAITGQLLADAGRWGGVSIKLPPEPAVEVVMAWTDGRSATEVAHAVTDGLELLAASELAKKHLADGDRRAIAKALAPRVNGTRVIISPRDLTDNANRLAKMLGPPIRMARQAAQRRQRMNQFKQLGLAFLNYESANGAFPAQTFFGDSDRPLLSWRVTLLPYLEEGGQLYRQFHLDEPWDSPHNRRLIEHMPDIYADPDRSLRKLAAAGKTMFVVPTGPGTIFEGNVERGFKDIIDGTSNTILFVEVAPEHAVIWTKPEDWEVDFADPWNGLRRDDRDFFSCAFLDGSTHTFDHRLTDENLSGLITPAGGEIVER